jgi:hypothetical protein
MEPQDFGEEDPELIVKQREALRIRGGAQLAFNRLEERATGRHEGHKRCDLDQ